MSTGNRTAFERVKDQIGFCGIWCGSCVVGNGALRELTKRYEKLTKAYGLAEWAPKDFDYTEFVKALTSIKGIPPCPGCLNEGGRDNCEIRACAQGKGVEDCSKCLDFDTCEHTQILNKMRSGALAAGLFVTSAEGDREELLAQWTTELRLEWPCCILFMHGR